MKDSDQTIRAGDDITEPTHIPTASQNEASAITSTPDGDDFAVDIAQKLARQVFEKRGNHSEAHISEVELIALLAVAVRRSHAFDLLAALKEVVDMYGPSTDYGYPAAAVWRKAETALANAEGRQG
jgi:hypothetical protein